MKKHYLSKILLLFFIIIFPSIAKSNINYNQLEQQIRNQLKQTMTSDEEKHTVDNIKFPSLEEYDNVIKKIPDYHQNEKEILKAQSIYQSTVQLHNTIEYCKPYYPMNNFTKNIHLISRKKEDAKNIILAAGDTDLLKLMDDFLYINHDLVSKQLDADYLETKKEAEKYGIKNLTKQQYCKSIDDYSTELIRTIDQTTESTVKEAQKTTNQILSHNTETYRRKQQEREEKVIGRLLLPIIFLIIYIIKICFARATLYIKNNYIDPRKNNREKYREYLKNCDYLGKTPLSYEQWKFAYTNKNNDQENSIE